MQLQQLVEAVSGEAVIFRRVLILLLLTSSAGIAEGDSVPETIQTLVPIIQNWGRNPVLVQAVKEKNGWRESLQQVQVRDRAWRSTSGDTRFMKSLMENPAAMELLRLERSETYFRELFLMDHQGANVAMTNKTSDYWQGDEAKFRDSYASGRGGVHVGTPEYDKSSGRYLVQISVPVWGEGKVIGALAVGIDMIELAKSRGRSGKK